MNFLPMNINIGGLKVNNEDHLGAISFSSTTMRNRNVCAKKNQGFGQQMADRCIRIGLVASINDNDILDSSTLKKNQQA
ncbi:hypothetical protein [Bacillus benzoevorans]|uniref:Uncharacterized protein n=1 Tax=Bacillus benzoevorans TaxID=1456 RepID=A0A7X0HW87_9BACI|nr:hypothetical protein [Bacillus benzoevorans]MBB6447077.1 hypothetical protein [Bacillus benzoevorans]